MPGPQPKKATLRSRRNRTATRATLPSQEESQGRRVPSLPKRRDGWAASVREWWKAIWTSPMAAEYVEADRQDLFVLAELRQDFADARTSQERAKLAAEIRLQGQRFGLSPIDRRRLQWEIEKGETAAERTQTRRQKKKRKKRPVKDPRKVLKVVK